MSSQNRAVHLCRLNFQAYDMVIVNVDQWNLKDKLVWPNYLLRTIEVPLSKRQMGKPSEALLADWSEMWIDPNCQP